MDIDVLKVIQMLVAPVVLISACGLLCLAFYNRLSILISRIRALNHERLEIQEKLNGSAVMLDRDALAHRSNAVDRQGEEIMRRAGLVRTTLFSLVLCIICMIVTSLCLGVSLLAAQMTYIALSVFVLGVLCLLNAMIFALRELVLSLRPVALDRDFMWKPQHDSQIDPM